LSNNKYYIPSFDLPEESPFIIEAFSCHRDEFVKRPHRHGFYEILWFTESGSGHHVDFKEYPVKKNSIHFIAPGKVHHLDIDHQEGYLMVFTQSYLAQLVWPDEDNFFHLFSSFDSQPYIFPSFDELHPLRTLFDLMISLYKKEPQQSVILRSYLRSFLLNAEQIKKARVDKLPHEKQQRVVRLLRLIEQHYKQERSVHFYADQLALTAKRCNEIIRHHQGKTVTQLINDRLILEAKRELSFNQCSVKEISYLLSFEDPAYFSRFFKKQTGVSPKEFKKECC